MKYEQILPSILILIDVAAAVKKALSKGFWTANRAAGEGAGDVTCGEGSEYDRLLKRIRIRPAVEAAVKGGGE